MIKGVLSFLLLLVGSSFVAAKLGESLHDRRELYPILRFFGSQPTQILDRCEGDCDRDSDCISSDLVCFQRGANEAVPGCSGGISDVSLSDYCVRRTDLNAPPPTPVPNPEPTPTPDRTPRVGIPIKYTTDFPLGLCEGDCDSNFDCEGNLICFQRNEYEGPIPGCIGGETDSSRTDYCVYPDIDGNTPTSSPTIPPVPGPTTDLLLKYTVIFPLARCEGDCDNDNDCQGNLVCFQRGPYEIVPGCIGGESDRSRVDYCVSPTRNDPAVPTSPPTPPPTLPPTPLPTTPKPSRPPTGAPVLNPTLPPTPPPTLLPTPNPTSAPVFTPKPSPGPTAVPTAACSAHPACAHLAGDCCPTSNGVTFLDCCLAPSPDITPPPTLAPVAGPTPNPTPPPTVAPVPDPTPDPTLPPTLAPVVGPTPNPTPPPTLAPVPDPTPAPTPPPTVAPVPDPTPLPTLATPAPTLATPSPTVLLTPKPTPNPTSLVPLQWSTVFPLRLCQGDCDSDLDCEGTMVCFQRDSYELVPGCLGGESDSSRVDYCIQDLTRDSPTPPTPPPVSGPTADKPIKWSTTFPLAECEGDCDNNEDCQDGLFCWQRDSGQSIPGCSGTDSSSVDYCIPKSKAPAKKIKMFWDNYFWQETYEEAFWCMACTECETLTTGDGWEGGCKDPDNLQCQEGHLIWIQRCRDTRNRFEIVENARSGNQIRVYGTNLCFSTIQNRWLELKPCDNRMTNQLWTPFSDRNKFELRPYSEQNRPTNEASCLSQLHHPKATEVIALRPCRENINHDTNYWTEYYG